jgi:hypothetical protein
MGRTRRAQVAAATLGAVLATAGCDGSGAGSEPDGDRRRVVETGGMSSAAPTTDAGVETPAAAYAAWVDALAREDAAAACALQAPDFTIDLRYEAILVDRAELGDPCVGFEALLWEDPAFSSEIGDVEVTQLTAEDALLEVHLGPGEASPQTVRMVYHRAQWRVFSTEARTDAGSGDAGPARWVAAWCDLSPDQTRDQIIAAMGDPSGEYTVADGGEPQLWWAQDQYDFRVYLDPVDDSVLELVGDYDALGAGDRDLLSCPELRS